MTLIEVLAPGMQTTVQDLGRWGFGQLGVSACGAADAMALRIGNRVIGNPDRAAALEMTLLGGRFLFRGDAWLALAGADFAATLDDLPVPLWTPFQAAAGQSLRLGGARAGARCYLCVQGGVQVPELLGSRSTHLPSRIGGFAGRALMKGDLLPIGEPSAGLPAREMKSEVLAQLRPSSAVLRITAAAQREFSHIEPSRFARRILERANRLEPHGPAAVRRCSGGSARRLHDHRGRAAGRNSGAPFG